MTTVAGEPHTMANLLNNPLPPKMANLLNNTLPPKMANLLNNPLPPKTRNYLYNPLLETKLDLRDVKPCVLLKFELDCTRIEMKKQMAMTKLSHLQVASMFQHTAVKLGKDSKQAAEDFSKDVDVFDKKIDSSANDFLIFVDDLENDLNNNDKSHKTSTTKEGTSLDDRDYFTYAKTGRRPATKEEVKNYEKINPTHKFQPQGKSYKKKQQPFHNPLVPNKSNNNQTTPPNSWAAKLKPQTVETPKSVNFSWN